MARESITGAAEADPLIVRDAKLIRVRDRDSGATDAYLGITSNSGLKGYAGPLLNEQVAAFPATFASCWPVVTLAIPRSLTSTPSGRRAMREKHSKVMPKAKIR